MPDARRLLIDLTIMTLVGSLLAVLGPFGTFAVPFALRLAYWVGIVLAGYALYLPAAVVATRLARRMALPEAALWVAACIAATVPMTIVTWAVGGLWHPLHPPSAEGWLGSYAHVLVLGSAITSIFWFRCRREGEATAVPPAGTAAVAPAIAAPPTLPAFLDRLPPHLGRDLIALEMEDHYVRAHTAAGSTLILMRMRDAVAELAAVDGRLVHRSWWVARAHVAGTARDGRNVRLILTGGIEAPVARGQAEALQAAGWLQRTATVSSRAAIG
ncbi:LytTR family DNA-binding domain-containing protein [Sphingomonas sp. 2R-10]|uniref:LytTR family DNA-binding domain-containing protein n=1 Tax=Sphingomonas sp. 2R-10 TaxID=3045148 RepID=UPI000F7685C2|nr:LytTR family DNA-binding domain-containing protein [Sphingomonas sp. 2R-10]MDJ0276362.1 LytTR family DNA-binding domain-containing protein [Sphingomonas sp. 2R-10]